MAYENKQQTQPNMSVILASKGAKDLGQNLNLTSEQLMKANSTALALSSNPTLRNCDRFSILKYCYETARYNFSREDCIYPVPYGNSIQAQLGYKGLRELVLRSGKYNEVNCSLVYSCDSVYRDEETGKIKVSFNKDYTKITGAKIIGYYAYAVDTKGEVVNTLFWSKEQAQEHGKQYSKTYNSLWGKDDVSFNKMAKKTLIKQLCSELSTTPEISNAISQDGYVYATAKQQGGYVDNPNNFTNTERAIDKVLMDETSADKDTGEVVDEVETPF